MAKQSSRKTDGPYLSEATENWIDQELAGCEFRDERLAKRFAKLFRQLSGGIGESIPWASGLVAFRKFLDGRKYKEASTPAL